MVSEAQKRATAKYAKKVKQVNLRFCPPEFALWNHLQEMENKNGFLKESISGHMFACSNVPSDSMGVEELALFLVHCDPGSDKFDGAAKLMQKKLKAYEDMQSSFE